MLRMPLKHTCIPTKYVQVHYNICKTNAMYWQGKLLGKCWVYTCKHCYKSVYMQTNMHPLCITGTQLQQAMLAEHLARAASCARSTRSSISRRAALALDLPPLPPLPPPLPSPMAASSCSSKAARSCSSICTRTSVTSSLSVGPTISTVCCSSALASAQQTRVLVGPGVWGTGACRLMTPVYEVTQDKAQPCKHCHTNMSPACKGFVPAKERV